MYLIVPVPLSSLLSEVRDRFLGLHMISVSESSPIASSVLAALQWAHLPSHCGTTLKVKGFFPCL